MAVKRWDGSAWITYAGADKTSGFEVTDDRPGDKVWVGSILPSNPADGDIWIDNDTSTNSIASTIFDAKGDLLVGTGSDTYTKQSIGLNGQILVADSAQDDGLKWDYAGARQGLINVVPTSIVKGASGTAAVTANGAVTFSGTESIALNGCFTSAYDNYRFVFSGNGSSHNEFQARYRVSGSDNSTSNYNWQYTARESTGAGTSSTSNTDRIFLGLTGATKGSITIDVLEPFATTYTTCNSINSYMSVGTNNGLFISGTQFNATTSFDGITFYMATGTLTGIIRVYGYNNGA